MLLPLSWRAKRPYNIGHVSCRADKKLSYRWQTARRLLRSVKVSKHIVPFYMLRMHGFLLVCYSNFEIFEFKKVVILKTGLGVLQVHWICHHSIERVWLPINVYSNYGSISCGFWNIQCRKYRVLEIPVKCHSRSLKVVPFDRLRMVSY